jgi:hypothetical protein
MLVGENQIKNKKITGTKLCAYTFPLHTPHLKNPFGALM